MLPYEGDVGSGSLKLEEKGTTSPIWWAKCFLT